MRYSDEQRLLAQTSPAGLAVATSQGKWQLARHLDLIDETIVNAVAGRGPRFMVVECPPRHGKSELISHRTPAWFLGMFPDKQVMLASYEATFAETWGRKSRDLLEDHGQGLYNVTVRQDARAQDRWYTSEGGVMAASGIGGRFTGMGADLLIIDDPIKNAEEARSPTIRAKHKDWWQSTALTRLHPGAVVIVLMTRWHEDDLGGYLLSQGGEELDEPFVELRLPALAEADDPLGRQPGEALWPERFSARALDQIRRAQGSYWWAAMYQGHPVPEGGGLFNADWFPIVPVAPYDEQHDVKWVRYWDLAATEETAKSSDPDYSVGALVGKTPANRYVIADIKRTRARPEGVERLLRTTAEYDGPDVPIFIEQEPGSNAKIAVSHLIRNVLDGYTARPSVSNKSKIVRADPVSAQAEAGNISLVKADWNEAFLSEARLFPNGSHDDQIDAVSGAFACLNLTGEARSFSGGETHTKPVVVRGDLVLVGEQYVDQP